MGVWVLRVETWVPFFLFFFFFFFFFFFSSLLSLLCGTCRQVIEASVDCIVPVVGVG